MINSTSLDRLQNYDPSNINSGNKNETTSKSTKLSASQKQNSDITIYTGEGDKVTISTGSQSQVSYSSYENLAKAKGNISNLQNTNLAINQSQSMSLTVEGNLSKEELQDINTAVKTIQKTMEDFLSGDINQANKHASKLGELSSISSLEATMQFESQTSFEQEINQNVTPTPQPPPPKENIEKLTDKMVTDVKDSNIKKPEQLFKSLNELFTDMLKNMSNNGKEQDTSPKVQNFNNIKSNFLEKLDKLFGSQETSAV